MPKLVRMLWLLPIMLCFGFTAGAVPAGEESPPPILKIGDLDFRVEMQQFQDSYAGMTYFDQRVIQIDPSSMTDLRRRVYLHELMHVAWHKGSASPDKNQKYTEEEAIESLVPGLLQILKQNPEAVDYLRSHQRTEQDSLAQR